jgi:hypothetical protein
MELQALRIRELRRRVGRPARDQMERLHVTTLKMVPRMESVMVPMVASQIDPEAGHFVANRRNESAAQTMLDELWRWAEALKPMRG